MVAAAYVVDETVGAPIPLTQHAISVSFPTWAVSIGYKERDLAVLDRLKGGYPRYWIHQTVRTVSSIIDLYSLYSLPNLA